ncbi:hypothetical protein ACEW2M_003965 [Escherichia coli]
METYPDPDDIRKNTADILKALTVDNIPERHGFPALNLATSDAAAVAGLVMTVLTVGLVSCAGKSLPRFWPGDFFPVFYACHLAVLGVLAL